MPATSARKAERLVRIATSGSGLGPPGERQARSVLGLRRGDRGAGCPSRPHGIARLARLPGLLDARTRVAHTELTVARIRAWRPRTATSEHRLALATPVAQDHLA